MVRQRSACALVHTDAPKRTHDGNGRVALPHTPSAP